MIWQEYYNQYLISLEETKQRLSRREQEHLNQWGWSFWIAEEFTFGYFQNLLKTEPDLITELSHLSDEDIQWFIDALADEQSKWFALYLIVKVQPLPESMFSALIQAAVNETNPSLNEHFIGVAYDRFGLRRVAEALIKYIERGTDVEEKLASAFYWVTVGAGSRPEEREELLAFYKTVATNPDYSDTVRQCIQVNYARLAYHKVANN